PVPRDPLRPPSTLRTRGAPGAPPGPTAGPPRSPPGAEGAATIDRGRGGERRRGPLVLPPPLCWHGHINESDHRTYWFDAANMPLVCALEASFFEPGKREDRNFWEVDEGDERLYRAAGLAPTTAPLHAPHSPKYPHPAHQPLRR